MENITDNKDKSTIDYTFFKEKSLKKENRINPKAKKYKTLRLEGLTVYEINNVVKEFQSDLIDISKIKAVIFKEKATLNEVIFEGQEELNYKTRMTIHMFFEDVFSNHYEQCYRRGFFN